MTEADIAAFRREEISVDEDNKPAPENSMQSDYVLTTPSSLTFGFHGVNSRRQSGNFPVGRAKLKMTPNPRIQHMSRLEFFVKLYFVDYIKDVVIPDTNKRLNSAINLSDHFCVIVFRLIMACYVGHSLRDFFLKGPITPHKVAPICLNHIISARRLENINQVMSYTNIFIPEFNDPFLQQRQMQEDCNRNMAAHFEPSWVSVLDDSIQEWINRYICPGWIFVPRKPHTFGNDYHTIVCAEYKVIYNVDIAKGKDRPIVMGEK